jgi:hypothetical protein
VLSRGPYYLLLVGDPASIPVDFQYLIDIECAVGRLSCDRPEQYHRYAQCLVAYETGAEVPNTREVVYWSPRHEGDAATHVLMEKLMKPLLERVQGTATLPIAEALGYHFRPFGGDQATKANLARML